MDLRKKRRACKKISWCLILTLLLGSTPSFRGSQRVAEAANKPVLSVGYDEISLKGQKMKKNSDKKNYTYSASVKNTSKTGTVKKIQYYYQIQVLKKVAKTTMVPVTPAPATQTPVVTIEPTATVEPTATAEPSASVTPSVTATPGGTIARTAAAGHRKNADSPQTTLPVENSTETPLVSETPAVTQTPESPETVVPEATETPSAAPTAASKPESKKVMITEWVPKKKTVVFTAKKIKPGKASAKISCEGDYSGKLSAMKLVKVKLYAGDALYTYRVDTGEEKITWGSADKKAPVFSGWIGNKSIYSGVTVRVCYTDRKDSYSFKDHVQAVDDRDGKVSFTVDTSKINWNKDGIYKVIYTAKDKAGNEAKAWAKVQVYKPGTAESIADEVLRSVINNSWSDEKKLRAIYTYVKGHCSYTDIGNHTNWRQRAVDGIRYQQGDCFTFYSMGRLLITRAGIPNLEVTRYPGREGYHHWWSLVYVKNGWYHFDTTPRRRDGKFCLVTYAQLLGYSSGNTFRHREDILPEEATKKISPNP